MGLLGPQGWTCQQVTPGWHLLWDKGLLGTALGPCRPSRWGLRGQIKDIPHNQVYLGTQASHSPFHSTPVLQIAANQSGVKHFYLFFLIQRSESFFFIVQIEASPQVVLCLRLKDKQGFMNFVSLTVQRLCRPMGGRKEAPTWRSIKYFPLETFCLCLYHIQWPGWRVDTHTWAAFVPQTGALGAT